MGVSVTTAWRTAGTEDPGRYRPPGRFRTFLWLAGFFALLVLLMVSYFVLAVVSVPLGDEPDAATLVVANTLAAFGMGTYLSRTHPRLLQRAREHGDPEYDD